MKHPSRTKNKPLTNTERSLKTTCGRLGRLYSRIVYHIVIVNVHGVIHELDEYQELISFY